MRKLILTALVCLLLTNIGSAQTGTTDTESNPEKPGAVSKRRGPVFRATKEQVSQVQTILREKGIYKGEIDGKFSSDFRSAIKSFQIDIGLKKTGTLNRATLEKAGIELTDKQKALPVNPNSFDTSKNNVADKPKRRSFRVNKEQISQAQTMLKNGGGFTGENTGKYSKEFRSAVKEYQAANGLKRKGSLNRATLEKLGIELTDSQKEVPVNQNDFAKADDGSPKPKRTIFRASKEQIIKVQSMLKTKSLYDGEETGKLNTATRAAIREWQDQNSVGSTGTLNKETLLAMGIDLTDKQKGM